MTDLRETDQSIKNNFARSLDNILDRDDNFNETSFDQIFNTTSEINKCLKTIEAEADEFLILRYQAKLLGDTSNDQTIEQKNLLDDNQLDQQYRNILNQLGAKTQKDQDEKLDILTNQFKSRVFIWLIILINCICFTITGAVVGVYNTMLNHLAIVFKWESDSDKDFYFGFVNSIVNIGACAACIILPFLKSFGIRKLLIFSLVLSVIGNILCVIDKNWALLLGRGLQGLCVGTQQSLGVKHVMNLTPNEYKGYAAILLGIYFRIGLLSVFVMGYGLPDEEDVKDNEYWRIQTLFPIIYVVIYLLALLLYFRYDSADIYYMLFKNNKAKQEKLSMGVLNRVYTEDRARREYESLQAIYDLPDITDTTSISSKKTNDEKNGIKILNRKDKRKDSITIKSLYFGEHRKAMWLCTGLVLFFQLPSTVVCIVFSKFLIEQADESESVASNFTTISSIVDLGAVFIGLYLAKVMKKKPQMLISGFLAIVVTLLFAICYSNDDMKKGVKFLVIAQRLVFSSGFDALFWGYFAEILPELGCGIIVFLFQFVQFIICQFFIQVFSSLGTEVFYILAGISLLLFAYLYFALIETKGLTRQQTINIFKNQKDKQILEQANLQNEKDKLLQAQQDEEKN